jgi:hypothetical protein
VLTYSACELFHLLFNRSKQTTEKIIRHLLSDVFICQIEAYHAAVVKYLRIWSSSRIWIAYKELK